MRPRKQDGKLNRHGLGARRVALLAPRGVLNEYRHPLSYVGAITKIYVKFKSKSRILGDVNSIPSGGGVPEGRRGSVTPMLEDGSLFSSMSTTNTTGERLRTRRLLRESTRETRSIFAASPSKTNTLSECCLSFRLTDSAEDTATMARGGRPLRACFDFNLTPLSRARKF